MDAPAASAFVRRAVTADAKNREPDDFYRTPAEGTEALLRVETFEGPIWEPACGDGAISKVLEAHGYEVMSTDLVDHGFGDVHGLDFLDSFCASDGEIVTNPPFKLAEKFVRHALDIAPGKVAMLLKLTFLEGQKRHDFFKEHPPARVWVFSKRLTTWRGGPRPEGKSGGMIAFAWFIWERGYQGPTVLDWLAPNNGRDG